MGKRLLHHPIPEKQEQSSNSRIADEKIQKGSVRVVATTTEKKCGSWLPKVF